MVPNNFTSTVILCHSFSFHVPLSKNTKKVALYHVYVFQYWLSKSVVPILLVEQQSLGH